MPASQAVEDVGYHVPTIVAKDVEVLMSIVNVFGQDLYFRQGKSTWKLLLSQT